MLQLPAAVTTRARAAADWAAGRASYLAAPWAAVDNLRTALVRVICRLDALSGRLDSVEGYIMAADRDLTRKLLTVLPILTGRVREVIEERNRYATENTSLRAELATLKGEQAADEQADLADLQPLEEGLNALDALVAPAANAAPDVTPVETVEEVPAVIEEPARTEAAADTAADAARSEADFGPGPSGAELGPDSPSNTAVAGDPNGDGSTNA